MRYEQPNVLLLGSAAAVVQGNANSKFNPVQPDNEIPGAPYTDGSAYQADE